MTNYLEVNRMKFDVVVGNPPYQEETKDTSDLPIYHLFMEESYQLARKVCLITPARWLFNAGKTPRNWNRKMLSDEHLKVIHYEQDSSRLFPNTDIKGGVAITYWSKKEKFGAVVTFTHFEELNSILKKVYHPSSFKSLSEIIIGQNKFNLDVLYEDYPEYRNVIGSDGRERRLTTPAFSQLSVFKDEKQSENGVQVLGLINNKRYYKWIDRKYIQEQVNFEKYKIILPKSNGSGAIGEVLSTPLIGEPLIGFTQSFISIGSFGKKIEAENALKYVKSKFSRVMLGILKITQDNPTRVWKYVPLQDFSQNLDIDWTKTIPEIDSQLYKKYGLSQEEINFIEEKIKAME